MYANYRGLCFTEEAELMIDDKRDFIIYVDRQCHDSTASSTSIHLKCIQRALDVRFNNRFVILYFVDDFITGPVAWGTDYQLLVDLNPLFLISSEVH